MSLSGGDNKALRGYKAISLQFSWLEGIFIPPLNLAQFYFSCNISKAAEAVLYIFSAQQHICYSALYVIARPSVRPSVCLSVCPSLRHTGGSVQDR